MVRQNWKEVDSNNLEETATNKRTHNIKEEEVGDNIKFIKEKDEEIIINNEDHTIYSNVHSNYQLCSTKTVENPSDG